MSPSATPTPRPTATPLLRGSEAVSEDARRRLKAAPGDPLRAHYRGSWPRAAGVLALWVQGLPKLGAVSYVGAPDGDRVCWTFQEWTPWCSL